MSTIDWPDGDYVNYRECMDCGVTQWLSPKRSPALCWSCYQEKQRERWRETCEYIAAMEAEYGPRTERH